MLRIWGRRVRELVVLRVMSTGAACKRRREEDTQDLRNATSTGDEVIARGAYGAVHRVRRPSEEGAEGEYVYAEKRYHAHETSSVLSSDYIVERIALAMLPTHAHVVHLLAASSPSTGRLLMPCARGTLAKYMTIQQPLPAIDKWYDELSAALRHLHAHGVVHRDLKPSNVLVFRDGPKRRLRIADFGSAAVLFDDRASMHDRALTTIPYAAPEVLRREAYDEAVDVWSLGMIMAELRLGRLCLLHDCETHEAALAVVQAADGRLAEARAALPGEWRCLLSSDPRARGFATAQPATARPRDTAALWKANDARTRAYANADHIRRTVVSWLDEVADAFRLCKQTTLANAVALFDLTMTRAWSPVPKPKVQTLACACVHIAAALVERCNIEVDEFVGISAGACTPEDFGAMQRLVLTQVTPEEVARVRCVASDEITAEYGASRPHARGS